MLRHLSDEGKGIEPECFWPVVPTLLLNGAAGIGTGYSTSVPPVDPEALVDHVAARVRGEEPPAPLLPWWRGHRGGVAEAAPGKYTVSGAFSRPNPATVEVTELPPGRSSDWFQEHLLQRCVIGHVEGAKPEQTFVRTFENRSTVERPHFVLACDRALLEPLDDEAVARALKLTDTVSLANMHVFDPSGQEIRRYPSLGAIADAFVEARLPVYEARLAHQIGHLENTELPALSARAEWIRAVVEGEVELRNLPKADAEAEIARRGLGDPGPLLGMSLLSMTKERYAALLQERDRKADELRELRATQPRDVWLRELEEVRAAWRREAAAGAPADDAGHRPAKRRRTKAAASRK